MKKFIIYMMLTCMSMSAFAQFDGRPPMNGQMPPMGAGGPMSGQKPPKKEKVKKQKKDNEEVDYTTKMPGKVYVFGFSYEFGDSVVYLSSLEEVDSIALTKKEKFLPFRYDFSQQFKDKVESKAIGGKNQTTCVYFSDKKEKLQKTYDKLRKRYLTKQDVFLVTVKEEDFKFVHPLDYFGLPSE